VIGSALPGATVPRLERAPRVSVFIPTFNRSRLLVTAVESVLDQDYDDFQVVVVDNASTDDTEHAIRSISDARLEYVRNESNIGLFRNWVRALDLNSSPYVGILPDDDAYLPGFIRRSTEVLDTHPAVAFSAALARQVDAEDHELAPQEPRGVESECIEGDEYLHQIVASRHWVIQPATVLMRASAVEAVGGFNPVHSATSFDFNLYVRLAARLGVAFVEEELAQVRVHEEQVSHETFRVGGATGPLTTLAEQMDAGAYLLGSERAADPAYRQWIFRKLRFLSLLRSQRAAELLPGLNLDWDERVRVATSRIAKLMPPGSPFVLVDNGDWDLAEVAGRQAIPLIEHEGRYWGPPADSDTAIWRLEQLREDGARTVVFGWPAFWWLEHYTGLDRYLQEHYARVVDDSFMIVFEPA
jgi:glycosyltransferase involved in cell wall biosynthesis